MKVFIQGNNTDLLVIIFPLSFLLESPEQVWQASIEITRLLFFFLYIFICFILFAYFIILFFLSMHIRFRLEPFSFQAYLCKYDIYEMKVLFKN